MRHKLDQDIDNLGTKLKVINIAVVPLLLTVIALVVVVAPRARGGAMSQQGS